MIVGQIEQSAKITFVFAGTYLTAKQKEEKARNEAFLEAMKARGLEVPQAGEKRGPRLGTRIRPNKNWKGKSETPESETKQSEEDAKVEVEVVEKKKEEKGEESDDVADAWDASSGDESDTAEDKAETEAKQDQPSPPAEKEQKKPGPSIFFLFETFSKQRFVSNFNVMENLLILS